LLDDKNSIQRILLQCEYTPMFLQIIDRDERELRIGSTKQNESFWFRMFCLKNNVFLFTTQIIIESHNKNVTLYLTSAKDMLWIFKMLVNVWSSMM